MPLTIQENLSTSSSKSESVIDFDDSTPGLERVMSDSSLNRIQIAIERSWLYRFYDAIVPLAPLWDVASDIIFTLSVWNVDDDHFIFWLCFGIVTLSSRQVVFFYFAHITQQSFFSRLLRRYCCKNCHRILPNLEICLKARWETVVFMYIPFYDYIAFNPSEPRYNLLFSLVMNVFVFIFAVPLYVIICSWQSYKAVKNNIRQQTHRGSFAFLKFLECFESLPQFGIQCWAYSIGMVDAYIFIPSAILSWFAIFSAFWSFRQYRQVLQTGFDAKKLNAQEIFNRLWVQQKWERALKVVQDSQDLSFDINVPHWGKKKTCLYFFCEVGGSVKTLKRLLDFRADISWQYLDDSNDSKMPVILSCLDVACVNGHLELLEGMVLRLNRFLRKSRSRTESNSVRQRSISSIEYQIPDLIEKVCFEAIEHRQIEAIEVLLKQDRTGVASSRKMFLKAIEDDQEKIVELFFGDDMLSTETISRGFQYAVLQKSMRCLQRLRKEDISPEWYEKALASAKRERPETEARSDIEILSIVENYPRDHKIDQIITKLRSFDENNLSQVWEIVQELERDVPAYPPVVKRDIPADAPIVEYTE